MNKEPSQTLIRVFAVIVLYQTKPTNSKTLQSLLEGFRRTPPGNLELKILLYDNTPGGQEAGTLPVGVDYKADTQNSGLAAAYNYALKLADEAGFDWLLTLDQDTSLPHDLLAKLHPAATFAASLRDVAAIVPCLFGEGRAMSPWIRNKYWIRPSRLPEGFIGIPPEAVYAANSVSTLRVSALKAIGGYDSRFHLWASDLVLYNRLHRNSFKVLVAGNIHVEHEASILDLKNRTTPGRYEDMLRADEAFYDEFIGRTGHLVLMAMTLHRLVFRLWTTGGDFSYFKVVFKFLLRGLFCSRKRRIESWNRLVDRRRLAISDAPTN